MHKLSLLFLCTVLMSCYNSTNQQSAFFRNDINHTGYYDERGLDSLTGTAWVFKTGSRIFSSPVICENRLFIGSDDGYLHALDTYAASMKAVDRIYSVGSILSSPAVSNGMVYFGSSDSCVYALR